MKVLGKFLICGNNVYELDDDTLSLADSLSQKLKQPLPLNKQTVLQLLPFIEEITLTLEDYTSLTIKRISDNLFDVEYWCVEASLWTKQMTYDQLKKVFDEISDSIVSLNL